jgi:hypothetical protein
MSREWNSSGVMQEFIKIAAESGLITSDLQQKELPGNAGEDTPVKDHRRYEPTEEYELEVEGGNLVEKAHPEQAWMARKSAPVKSMGEGSLVENIEEQQKKDIEIATKMPAGALPGIHASMISELVKLANQLDGKEKVKEAARIDETIERLGRLPFVDSHLRKEGGWFLPVVLLITNVAPLAWNYFFNKGTVTTTKGKPGVGKGKVVTRTKAPMARGGKIVTAIGLGLTALTFLGKKMTSVQEGIKKDTKDFYDILRKAAPKSGAAAAAAAKLAPYVKEFEKKLQKPEDYELYRQKVVELKGLLPSIRRDIDNALSADIEAGLWTWTGLDLHSRIAEKLDTWESDLENVKVRGARLENVAKIGFAQMTGAAALQQILMSKGLLNSKQMTGSMDGATLNAARQLEKRLDRDTEILYNKKVIDRKPKGGFEGKIVRDKKLIMKTENLRTIIRLVDLLMSKHR